jgi:hypothetical protein
MPSRGRTDVYARPIFSVIEEKDPPALSGAARWSPDEGWSEVNTFNHRCDDVVC